MSIYIIGDVQACYSGLQQLLEKIAFNPKTDQLGFVGDLVGRGNEALETLRFIKKLNNPIIVLGNHDLYLLALAHNSALTTSDLGFQSILAAKDKIDLLDYLQQQPLMHTDLTKQFVLVHAGIPPQWDLNQAQQHANEISAILQSPKSTELFQHMEGNEPLVWNNQLTGSPRYRYIINALTRMRFCTHNGELDLDNKTNQSSNNHFKPWFEWRSETDADIIYGHWAALQGQSNKKNIYALDTGFVWGGSLTALRLEDKQLFSIDAT